MAGRSVEGPDEERLRLAFGDAVRAARTKLGLSQEALAEACEKHRTYVSLIERGSSSPTLTTIARIATALELSASELVGRAERRAKRLR